MRHLFAILCALCFCQSSVAEVYISQDITLDASNSFPSDTVGIYDGDDGPTTVFMLAGGFVDRLNAYDRTTLYVSGGGTIGADMSALDDATLYLSGGIVADDLRAHDRSVIHITGGEVLSGSTHATDNSTINIHGGLLSHLAVDGNAKINVFGRELAFTTPEEIHLVGILADGSPIDVPIQRLDSGTISLNVVPEPSAIVLAAIGFAAWLAQRRLWRRVSVG